MKKTLRRNLYRYLALASLISAMLAAGGLWGFTELFYRRYYAQAEADGIKNIRGRLQLFDVIVSRAERDAFAQGRSALEELGRRYPRLSASTAPSPEALSAEAKALGVSEIYFIGRDGVIFASSLTSDIGLSLFPMSQEFKNGLLRLYRTGTIADQRVSQSTRLGSINVYQYYGPKDADFLIEVSTHLSTLVDSLFPKNTYKGLSDLAFGGEAGAAGGPVRLVDLIGDSNGTLWSLLAEGQTRNAYLPLVAGLEAGESGRVRSGAIETVLVKVPLSKDGASVSHSRRYAVLRIDRTALAAFRLVSVSVFVLAVLIAVFLSLLIARRGLGRYFAARVERLDDALSRGATHREDIRYDEYGDDEISSIAKNAASLVADLRAQAESLRTSLSEQLALHREIHHRVKNNLQVILSLIGLQVDAARDPGIMKALEATKSRLYGMSLVLDRVHAGPRMDRLQLSEFLGEYCYYLEASHRRPGLTIALDTNAGELGLAADAAVPLGLLVGELVTNSLTHAFPPGRGAGCVSVALLPAAEGAELVVSDDGVGGDPGDEKVGMSIIRALAGQLGAVLSIEVAGGRRVRVSLPRGVADPAPARKESVGA